MSELDNLLPESFFADALAEVEEVEEEEEEVSFKGYMSLEEYIEQNPVLGKTIEELKDVFSKNVKEWRKTSWLSAIKRLYVLSKRIRTISSIPTDLNGEYKIEVVNGFTVLNIRDISGVESILHYYDEFDCFKHKSFEKSKENFKTYKDPKKLLSAMYSYFCSLDESEFKTKWFPEGHSNLQVVPLLDNIGVELYLPKAWYSKTNASYIDCEEKVHIQKNTFRVGGYKSEEWQRFVFKPSFGVFVECAMFSPYEIKPEEMVELAKEAVTMPYADYKETNTWKEITSREPIQFFDFQDEEYEEYESLSEISDI